MFVRLENPETGGVWDCPADYADIARARGWVDTDKPLPGEDAEDLGDRPTADFDPANHTVVEVNAYLAQATPDEVERVLDLEASGKNRSTIAAPEPTTTEGVSLDG